MKLNFFSITEQFFAPRIAGYTLTCTTYEIQKTSAYLWIVSP